MKTTYVLVNGTGNETRHVLRPLEWDGKGRGEGRSRLSGGECLLSNTITFL